jgi:hypothetical protein
MRIARSTFLAMCRRASSLATTIRPVFATLCTKMSCILARRSPVPVVSHRPAGKKLVPVALTRDKYRRVTKWLHARDQARWVE